MSRLNINIGTTANDRTGDPLRTAFEKVNANFIELYATTGADLQLPLQTGNEGKFLRTDGENLSWVEIINSNNTGDFTFTNSAASVPVNSTLTLTALNNTTLESKLTLSPTTKSSLYAANNLELGIGYGTGFEKYWLFGADGSIRFPDASVQTTAYTGSDTGDYIFDGISLYNPTGAVDIFSGALNGPYNGELYLDDTGVRVLTNNATNQWRFENTGTLTTPILFPKTFTAIVDDAHYAGTLTLTGDAWYFEVEFRTDSNGDVETLITNNTPWPSNPGYTNGMAFDFTEADHGIPGYTFTITLYDIQNPGPMMYTTNLTVNPAPAYPATIASATSNHIVLETSRSVAGGTETATNSNPTPSNVFFGYFGFTPTIDNVQVGWTVSGDGLVGIKTVTDVALGGFENGYWTITIDGGDGSTFAYNGTYTFSQASSVAVNQWTFSNIGVIRLPAGGDITDSTGTSVLGTPTALDGGNASTTF
jgi:hypothetical protein